MDLDKYLKIQETDAGEWEGEWANQMLDALFSHVSYLPKDAKILDIGCHTGRSLYELEKAGYSKAYGIDLIESKTKHAKKLGLNALTMNMEDLSMFSDQYFDFGFMSHAIEHSLNPDKAIKEMLRVCKHGLIICPLDEKESKEENSPHVSPFFSQEEWESFINNISIKQLQHKSMKRLGKEIWTTF